MASVSLRRCSSEVRSRVGEACFAATGADGSAFAGVPARDLGATGFAGGGAGATLPGLVGMAGGATTSGIRGTTGFAIIGVDGGCDGAGAATCALTSAVTCGVLPGGGAAEGGAFPP